MWVPGVKWAHPNLLQAKPIERLVDTSCDPSGSFHGRLNRNMGKIGATPAAVMVSRERAQS